MIQIYLQFFFVIGQIIIWNKLINIFVREVVHEKSGNMLLP